MYKGSTTVFGSVSGGSNPPMVTTINLKLDLPYGVHLKLLLSVKIVRAYFIVFVSYLFLILKKKRVNKLLSLLTLIIQKYNIFLFDFSRFMSAP